MLLLRLAVCDANATTNQAAAAITIKMHALSLGTQQLAALGFCCGLITCRHGHIFLAQIVVEFFAASGKSTPDKSGAGGALTQRACCVRALLSI